MFKNKSRLCKNVNFKDQIPKYLTSGVICKFPCGLYNESYYGECVRHLNVRIGDHIGISPLTKNKLSLRTALLIIYYFATTRHPMKILLF